MTNVYPFARTIATSDNWNTPPELKEYIYNRWNIQFDACPENPQFDGLSVPWMDRTYCNPPYVAVRIWLDKILMEQAKGNTVVLLMPARINTKYFKDKVLSHISHLIFLRGSLKFERQENPLQKPTSTAPWPSLLCVFPGAAKQQTSASSFAGGDSDVFTLSSSDSVGEILVCENSGSSSD
jgi:hypothetical protein